MISLKIPVPIEKISGPRCGNYSVRFRNKPSQNAGCTIMCEKHSCPLFPKKVIENTYCIMHCSLSCYFVAVVDFRVNKGFYETLNTKYSVIRFKLVLVV